MSSGLESFALKEEDAMKLLACQTHIGAANCDFQMEQYVWKRRVDGDFSFSFPQFSYKYSASFTVAFLKCFTLTRLEG